MAFYPCNLILEKSQIAEDQKIRDRKRRGMRSFNRYFNHINEDGINKIKRAKNIIRELEYNHGPAGLIHIPILSDIIRRPIKIRNANGSLNRIIGRTKPGHPINIEYHVINYAQIGHWTLRYNKEPNNANVGLNNCLFAVIGSQTRQNPSELRRRTILKLKNNLEEVINRIDEIFQLEGNDGVALMVGGARYSGNSPRDAGRILDNSQNQYCYPHTHLNYPRGHPRGHASSPDTPDNVETYSRYSNKPKSGFLSRTDQDYVTHLALKSLIAKYAMERLNNGSKNEVIHIPVQNLTNSIDDFPKAKMYRDGKDITEEKSIIKVVLVLRHHLGQYENPAADVFVQTCYPVIEENMI